MPAKEIRIGFVNRRTGEASNPNPSQHKYLHSKAKYVLGDGGFGSGKTDTLIIDALDHATEYPGASVWIFRKTFIDLKDSLIPEFFDLCPDELIINWNRTNHDLTLRSQKQGTAEVHFRSLKGSQRQKDIRRFRFEASRIDLDEANEAEEEELQILQSRLRNPKVPDEALGIRMVTNPGGPDHWMLKRFKIDDPDYCRIPLPTRENAHNLPKGYIDELELSYGPDWVRRYLDGEWCYLAEGDPVYPLFRELTHAYHPIPYIDNNLAYRSWDFGSRYGATVFAQMDSQDRLCVQQEFMGHFLTTHQLKQVVLYISNQIELGDVEPRIQKLIGNADIKPFYPKGIKFYDYCDPAGKQTQSTSGETDIDILNAPLFDESHDKYRIFPQYQASRIEEGLRKVRHLLNDRKDGTPGIYIDPNCETLIQGFAGGYKLRKSGERVLEDEPEKDGYYDHLQDALRYMALHLFKAWTSAKVDHRRKEDTFKAHKPTFKRTGW